MRENRRLTSRLALNAIFIALYIVLSMLAITIGGLKITFEHFPVILCAVLYGPVDAILVGTMGELFNQLTSFGLTPTTLLWILPIVFRGACIGICGKVLAKWMSPIAILQKKIPVCFLSICILSGIVSSALNTFAFYVDSKMFGYYSYVLVFGSLIARLALGVVTSVIIGYCVKTVLYALRKANYV
ncbi:MAG: ECF transporter S component [Faecalimonas sp.]|nr:ECF transporter S component [Faecalimonas sp.]